MAHDLFEREHLSIFQTYKRLPIAVHEAEGCLIFGKNGVVYLDFLAGIAVNALGHSHPRIIEAITWQISKYMHVSNYFYQEPQIKLAEKLKSITGFDRVFFSNSGTEAMEGALKLAKRWGNQRGKTEIMAFTGGFHGRSYGALSIMDKPLYKDGMGPFLSNTHILPFNDSESLENYINEKICAVVLEFIQGEGGIVSAAEDFIQTLNQLKEKFGFLIIADEIQAGTGRTGKFFGFNHYDVSPDIVTMAKAIGGGLPLGAILAREEIAGVWEKGMHGTTYGGNAVACAAGLVVLDELENSVLENVNRTGSYFKEKLISVMNDFPGLILEFRGKGLFLGLLLSFDASILVDKLLGKKVITNAASGNVLRILPPLIVKESYIDEFILKLRESLKEI